MGGGCRWSLQTRKRNIRKCSHGGAPISSEKKKLEQEKIDQARQAQLEAAEKKKLEQEEKAAEVSCSIIVKYLSYISRIHSDGQLTVIINLIQAEARKQAQAAAAEQKRAAAGCQVSKQNTKQADYTSRNRWKRALDLYKLFIKQLLESILEVLER